ncbi:MerR family transcriptional regulator [Sinomonas sp. G460-2]|uniref:MerR family transcriptional regulator n=1 Tax=Sinomonas sp. G460-2 TaxID=3393464 RepID=UPI0039EEDBA0
MRISEAAAAAGTTAKTLRFYESIGLMPEQPRTSSGYREYPPEAVQRAAFIRRSRAAGLTLEQTHQILRLHDTGTTPCGHVREQLEEQLGAIDRQIAELTALRAEVAQHYRAASAGPDGCDTGEICSYL